MSESNRRKTSKAESTEQSQQELDDILIQVRRKETLTAMAGVALSGLRLLEIGMIKLVPGQRDDDMAEKWKGPPCCPKCCCKTKNPNK